VKEERFAIMALEFLGAGVPSGGVEGVVVVEDGSDGWTDSRFR